MLRRKDEGIKVVTQKEMEKSFKRIDKAFPAIEEDDLLRSVLYHGIQMGARLMADDLTCGGCDADYYESAREEADEIALGVVFEKGILSGGKCVVVGDGDGLKEFLKEVLG